MTDSYRRFELLLPLRFNDGQRVPDELIGEIASRLKEAVEGIHVPDGH